MISYKMIHQQYACISSNVWKNHFQWNTQAVVRRGKNCACLNTDESPAPNLHTVGIQQILLKWEIEINSFVWFSLLPEFFLHMKPYYHHNGTETGSYFHSRKVHLLYGKNHAGFLTLFEIHWITAQFPILSYEGRPSPT